MTIQRRPSFDFKVPRGYCWLLERGVFGFGPFGPLQPWYLLDSQGTFSVSERWPGGDSGSDLFAFAKRQDNDDLACFEVIGKSVKAIVLVHGWTGSGYSVVARYDTVWDWAKAVVDDVAEWSELEADDDLES